MSVKLCDSCYAKYNSAHFQRYLQQQIELKVKYMCIHEYEKSKKYEK